MLLFALAPKARWSRHLWSGGHHEKPRVPHRYGYYDERVSMG